MYVLWRGNGKLNVVRRLAGQPFWQGPWDVGQYQTDVWGPSFVGGLEGKLGVAWFQRDPASQNDWTVVFRQVTDAHLVPVLGEKVVVDPHAADREFGGRESFLDFLTLARLSNGGVVIAYNCYTNDAPSDTLCTQNRRNPILATQTDGPGI